MVNVANRIMEHLKDLGETPYWLAKQTGISTQSIYHIVNDGVDVDDMKYKTVRLIATALQVDYEDLRKSN